MSYILQNIGGNPNIAYHKFCCDEKNDLQHIDVSMSPMGSTCYVINTGETYILNSQKQWKISATTVTDGNSSSSANYVYDGGEEV